MISARAVRSITIGVCVAGIAGMIVTSALDHNGAAITFGLVTAVAILCSIVATSVAADADRRAGPAGQSGPAWGTGPAGPDQGAGEALATIVEEQVKTLVGGGADEQAVRRLVGEAVRLGRTLGRPRS
jgi:hypothetical protein